jgi:hypothetical protein
MQGSLLMTVYPMLLLSGVALGLILRPGPLRRWMLGLLAGGALLLAAWQYGSGFPLEHGYRSIAWQRVIDSSEEQPPTPESIEEEIRELVRTTGWFWLAQSLTLAGLLLLVVEGWNVPRVGPPGIHGGTSSRRPDFSRITQQTTEYSQK